MQICHLYHTPFAPRELFRKKSTCYRKVAYDNANSKYEKTFVGMYDHPWEYCEMEGPCNGDYKMLFLCLYNKLIRRLIKWQWDLPSLKFEFQNISIVFEEEFDR